MHPICCILSRRGRRWLMAALLTAVLLTLAACGGNPPSLRLRSGRCRPACDLDADRTSALTHRNTYGAAHRHAYAHPRAQIRRPRWRPLRPYPRQLRPKPPRPCRCRPIRRRPQPGPQDHLSPQQRSRAARGQIPALVYPASSTFAAGQPSPPMAAVNSSCNSFSCIAASTAASLKEAIG